MALSLINIVLFFVLVYMLFNWKSIAAYNIQTIVAVVILNFIIELTIYFINKAQFSQGSSWLYNFTLPAEVCLYGLLYKRIFNSKLVRAIITAASLGIFIPFAIHYLKPGSFFLFNEFLYTYTAVFVLIIVLIFFGKLFVKDYFFVNPLKQVYFWISSGLLICYLGAFMLLTNTYALFYTDKILYADLKTLNLFLNFFLYGCMIVGIECLKKFRTYQIQSL